jgi:ribosomal protein S18 acetylase RimI-like enzyme
MRATSLKRSHSEVDVRAGGADDLDGLVALEQVVFAADAMTRRSLKRFLASQTADVLIAEFAGEIVGCAIVLSHPKTSLARLYSIAVLADYAGAGVGPVLLAAAEDAARARGRNEIRLEVHENNERAISCYRKSGYDEFGRLCGYYRDFGDALRFRKRLLGSDTRWQT